METERCGECGRRFEEDDLEDCTWCGEAMLCRRCKLSHRCVNDERDDEVLRLPPRASFSKRGGKWSE